MIYFVTAIGTDSGKTLFSSILVEALKADYWKPIQAGFPRDTDAVQALVTNDESRFHNEAYLLNAPASPHAAAAIDNVTIKLSDLSLPNVTSDLVIEGAGGALVPINDNDFVIDIAKQFDAQVFLVSNLYLGSINHTLLTYEALKSRRLNLAGIIFNGNENPASEAIILKHTQLKCLLRIKQEPNITKELIREYAERFNAEWRKWTS